MRCHPTILSYPVPLLLSFLAACQTSPDKITRPGEPVALVGKSIGRSSQYDIPPKLLSGRAPIYPIKQLQAGNSGSALIEFTIDEQGIPRDFRIVKTDYRYFATHAIVAMREWRFQPAIKNGKAVAVRARMPFSYHWTGPRSAREALRTNTHLPITLRTLPAFVTVCDASSHRDHTW